jgi:hypothetical protein
MGYSRTRTGGKRGCLCAAGVACAVAFAFSAASHAQPASPGHDSPARGAAGVIVQYEEAPGSNVLYLQETGGMVSAVTSPLPKGGEPAVVSSSAGKAQALAQASPVKASAAPARVARRRVAPPDGAGNRP